MFFTIIISFLLSALFGSVTWWLFDGLLDSFRAYTDAKTIWLKNIGVQYLQKLNRAKAEFTYRAVLFFCFLIEALAFLISFAYTIYLRLNP